MTRNFKSLSMHSIGGSDSLRQRGKGRGNHLSPCRWNEYTRAGSAPAEWLEYSRHFFFLASWISIKNNRHICDLTPTRTLRPCETNPSSQSSSLCTCICQPLEACGFPGYIWRRLDRRFLVWHRDRAFQLSASISKSPHSSLE
jgi:hypothetical protein